MFVCFVLCFIHLLYFFIITFVLIVVGYFVCLLYEISYLLGLLLLTNYRIVYLFQITRCVTLCMITGGLNRALIRFMTLLKTCFMIQKGRNALIDKRYRWKFPIPYILGDDLGKFV